MLKILPLILAVALSASAACSRGIDKERYEQLYRAGKQLSGATSVGVTLARYRELLQGLATELDIAEDNAASESEKALVTAYRDVLLTFKDAETAWKATIDLASIRTGDGTPLLLEGPAGEFFQPLVDTYNLERLVKTVNGSKVIYAEEMQQGIWAAGGEDLAIAEALYNGTPAPARK